MKYHIIAFFFGFILDLFLGDPYWLPHPIRLIGGLISRVEKMLRQEGEAVLGGAQTGAGAQPPKA